MKTTINQCSKCKVTPCACRVGATHTDVTPLIDLVKEQLQLQEGEKYLQQIFIEGLLEENKRVVSIINEDRRLYKKTLLKIADPKTSIVLLKGIAKKSLEEAVIAPMTKEYGQ